MTGGSEATSAAAACGLPSDSFDLAIGEAAFLGKVAVLGSDEAFHRAVSAQLGFDLPRTANRVHAQGDLAAMWLSPSEWMLVTPQGHEGALVASLQAALAEVHALVVDVSDRWTVISVAGGKAAAVLGKGTSVALAAPAFAVGRCCQTRLFSLPAIIRQVDDRPRFDIFVDSTLSHYIRRWLAHSAAGLDVQAFGP